jgi:hypothetical protein
MSSEKVLINMRGSVLHNATAKVVRRTDSGSTILMLLGGHGAYRSGDKVTVGPGECSPLIELDLAKPERR